MSCLVHEMVCGPPISVPRRLSCSRKFVLFCNWTIAVPKHCLWEGLFWKRKGKCRARSPAGPREQLFDALLFGSEESPARLDPPRGLYGGIWGSPSPNLSPRASFDSLLRFNVGRGTIARCRKRAQCCTVGPCPSLARTLQEEIRSYCGQTRYRTAGLTDLLRLGPIR
jgi:hypothetical protein